MTRVSSRAIVFIDQKVVLIHRKRDGQEYWVTPGGRVEAGETLQEAVRREVKEEIGIDVQVGEQAFAMTNHVYGEDSEQHFFLCTHVSGIIERARITGWRIPIRRIPAKSFWCVRRK